MKITHIEWEKKPRTLGKVQKIKNLEGVGLFHPFQNTLYIYCPYILSLICGTNMLQRFNSAVTNLTNTGIVHMQYNFSAVSCGSCSPRSTCDRRQRTSVNSKAAYTGEFLEEASTLLARTRTRKSQLNQT